MNLLSLITKTRSFRRFDSTIEIEEKTLCELINLARLAPSARNAQPLKYLPVTKPADRDAIFPLLSWAGYLKDWDGPAAGEQPTAYIVVLKDRNIAENSYCDDGLAIQNIMLGATERGLGGCIIGAVAREKLHQHFALPKHLEILFVLALGKPAETVVLDEMTANDCRYWRDEHDIHHVPKRTLDEIILSITK
ncbi:MAG: nitroreductase family protein [Prevotellaceae bacterium]|jgi:nitroreductase|nr:nitroreductase family protein [Prevotellaceae bacterium]